MSESSEKELAMTYIDEFLKAFGFRVAGYENERNAANTGYTGRLVVVIERILDVGGKQ